MYNVNPITSPRPNDCGPTCLEMLLAYYGTDIDLETLIKECNPGMGGCSAADLMRVGDLHGMETHAYKMDTEELFKQDRPSIIHWKGNHFVVFCGLNNDGNPVICNPDRGRYYIPKATFAVMYSGVALFNGEPIPEPDMTPRATKTIAKGEYFMHNGELCKAIAPIANGAILTLNTNYITTTVEDELSTLNK